MLAVLVVLLGLPLLAIVSIRAERWLREREDARGGAEVYTDGGLTLFSLGSLSDGELAHVLEAERSATRGGADSDGAHAACDTLGTHDGEPTLAAKRRMRLAPERPWSRQETIELLYRYTDGEGLPLIATAIGRPLEAVVGHLGALIGDGVTSRTEAEAALLRLVA
ncbi:MAG TPA: hypothetical protein DHV14_12405 [Micrococcales bacterium]|uniref:hypothetical protein n=1 Tax=Miniimonas arenae TaxID=676201 RepID=UPI000EC812AA|nr:hypothetical protein [Miniimonas arenae]HCX85910.1 hypothetical protein [Micrococcales bacterium]